MYYQQSSAKVFWIAFVTSLVVSSIVSFAVVYFVPEFLSENMETVKVPDVENLELRKAEMIVAEKELKIIVEDEKNSTVIEEGRIIYQDPIAGQIVERGSTINVALSTGPRTEASDGKEIVVPSVIGFDLNQAKVYLAERGLSVGVINREESEKAKDVVLKTIPEPGKKITEEVPIKLIISSGRGKVTVPSLRGKSEYSARSLLGKNGLEMRKSYTTSVEHAFDIVIYQDPKPGTKVERGSTVSVTINREG